MIIENMGGYMIGTAASCKTLMLVMIISIAMVSSCVKKPAATVTDADNGTRVEIKSGEILAVQLSAQLGTGFGWKVVSAGKNLALKGEPEQISKEGQMPGAPNYQIFRFKAAEKGEAELKLQYIEGWKKDEKPLKEFTITVNVQ
jgi:predicted secreted protein